MIDFKGKVIVITGAGAGLGYEYAKFFASRGANLVLNDLAKNGQGYLIEGICKDIESLYKCKAVPVPCSVVDGATIIKAAMDNFGRIDVLINNAGIVRDKSFLKMTDDDWNIVMDIHIKGAYACTKAAWPIFKQQNFGRIINTSSGSGLYGNFGQANYSSAKNALVGLTKTLAKEAGKNDIRVNAIAPIAATGMTKGVISDEVLKAVKPEYIVPLVAVLCSKECPSNGRVFEVGAGWIAEVRHQRSEGISFPLPFTPEQVL